MPVPPLAAAVNCGETFICAVLLGRQQHCNVVAGCARTFLLGTVMGMEPVASEPPEVPVIPKVPLLQLVTRSGCHLCENAREVVSTVAGQLQLRWTEVSLDDHPELTELYAEEIPVVLVNGIQRDFWHIDPIRLGNVLSRALTGD